MSDRPKTADEWFDMGSVAHESLDLENAVTAFRKVIELEPNQARGYYWLGCALWDQDSTNSDTISCFERAEALDPSHPTIYYDLGDCYLASGRVYPALTAYNKHLAQTSQPIESLELIIESLQDSGFSYEASIYANKLLVFDDENDLARRVVGRPTRTEQIEKWEEGLRWWISEIARAPLNTNAMSSAALLYDLMGRHQEALDQNLKVLEIDSNVPGIRSKIAKNYEALGNEQMSLYWAEEAIKHDPSDLDALFGKGELLFQKGDFAAAKPFFQRAWEEDPNYPQVGGYVFLLLRPTREYPHAEVSVGDALVNEGRFDEAVDFFLDSVVNSPNVEDIALLYLTKLGLSLVRLGRAGGTRSDLEQIRRASTTYTFDEPLTPENLGELLIGIADDASSGQDGSDFERYLSVSDYRLLHEFEFDWVRWRLIRRLCDHPGDAEARELLGEIEANLQPDTH